MIQGSQTSVVRSFSQADFDSFARLSGDANPIHIDPEFSADTRFGRTVAHGLLLCSVLRGLIEQLVPGGRLAAQSVMFPAPTFAGEAMRFVVTVTGREHSRAPTRFDCQLEVVRVSDDEITCQGHGMVVK
jgi:acyl dehydratase